MIRQFTEREVVTFLEKEGDWQRFRIQNLLSSYGLSYDFCRFYRQDNSDTCLCILDSQAILSVEDGPFLAEEWADFLRQSNVQFLLASGKDKDLLVSHLPGYTPAEGLIFEKTAVRQDLVLHLKAAGDMTALQVCYTILSKAFDGLTKEKFPAWYCDISHRIRHGCCTVYWNEENGCFTAYHQKGRVLFSQIAVSPSAQKNGIGRRLLTEAETLYAGKQLAVYSKDAGTDRFYHHLGYQIAGSWVEFHQIKG